MKRARGRNVKNRHEELDVPEMLKKTNQRQTVRKPVSKKKKKKKKNGLKSFLIIVFALLAAFLIIMGMGWGGNSEDEGALVPVDMEKGKLNVLVLGVDKDIVIQKFRTGMPCRFDSANGKCMINGCIFTIDDKTGRCVSAERVSIE